MNKKIIETKNVIRQSIILLIIFCSIVSSITVVSAVDKTYYWDRTTGVSIGGYTTSWSSCSSSPENGYKVTSLGSWASSCTNGVLSRSNAGDLFLAIAPTAYSSDTQIRGMSNARFYLKSNSGSATYRFDLGYALSGTFTSLGNVTRTGVSTKGTSYAIDFSTINGTAPAGSNLALKVSVTTSRGGRVYMGTNGGTSGSNSGRFYVDETILIAPRYDVIINASPTSSDITPGNSHLYNITISNTGNTNGNYTLSVTDSDTVNFTVSTLGITTMQINNGSSAITTLTVTAKTNAIIGSIDNTTVTIISAENPAYTNYTMVHTTDSAPTYNVSIIASPKSGGITSGNSYLYTITVNNSGNANGNYTLNVTDSDTGNFTSSTLGITTMKINSGGSAMTTLTVTARTSATTGAIDDTTIAVTNLENTAYMNTTLVQTTITTLTQGPYCLDCHAGAE